MTAEEFRENGVRTAGAQRNGKVDNDLVVDNMELMLGKQVNLLCQRNPKARCVTGRPLWRELG